MGFSVGHPTTWTLRLLGVDRFLGLVMMAMLSGLAISSLWTEILTTRFEFQPVWTSYSVLCAKSSSGDASAADASAGDASSSWQASLCHQAKASGPEIRMALQQQVLQQPDQ